MNLVNTKKDKKLFEKFTEKEIKNMKDQYLQVYRKNQPTIRIIQRKHTKRPMGFLRPAIRFGSRNDTK
jgi:hypothetical protein